MKASFFFIKYKKIQAPFEIKKKAVDFGWKCRKYTRWNEVHTSSQSRQILKSAGDSLVDLNELPVDSYEELSGIFCKVYSWAVNKDDPEYDLMPEVLLEYEKFERAIVNGSHRPGIIDTYLLNKEIPIDKVKEKDRWLFYVSLQINNYFSSTNRFTKNFPKELFLNNQKDLKGNVELSANLIREILGEFCFSSKILSLNDEKLIYQFLDNLDLDSTPKNTDRSDVRIKNSISRVLVEKISIDKSIFVKFELIEDQLVIKLNTKHAVINSKNKLFDIYKKDEYWILIGEALFSNLGKIKEIEKFYTSLGIKIAEYE